MSTFESDSHPTVSIIVPTFNRRDRLKRLLLRLEQAHSAGARFEVVVTVDGATDGTLDMLARLRTGYPLRALTQPNRGPAAARNRAMAAAHGDVLLFLDDDVVPTEGLIECHRNVHRKHPAGVAIGPMLAPPGRAMAPWLQWEAATLRKFYDAMATGRKTPTPRVFYTGNASVRREHALAAGGFDESFTRAEDVELAYRLADRGLRFFFLPAAAVLHEPDRTFQSWLRVPYEYGRHAVLMDQGHGRNEVRLVYQQLRRRHPLSRFLARWCVGHPWRVRAVVTTFGWMIVYSGPRASVRLQLGLCSVLSTIQYWQGVADAIGLGACVWRRLQDEDQPAPTPNSTCPTPHCRTSAGVQRGAPAGAP